MGTIKPWQIVVMVLAVLVAGGSLFYSCSGDADTKVSQADSVTLVDIKTGALFEAKFPERRPVIYPANHPDTGEPTLYPAYEKEGAWYLSGRHLPEARRDKNLNKDLLADSKAGQLKIENTSPKRADVFGK